MRSLIATSAVSVDGYDRDQNGNPLVLTMDAAFDRHNLSLMRRAAVVLLGARSFEMFSSFWPMVANAPQDPANPALSATNREFSRLYNQVPKVVISDSLVVAPDNPWAATTQVVARGQIAAWIKANRDGDGDIVTFASRTLWNGLLEHGLVDEIQLVVSPIALGAGTPAFARPTALHTIETRQLEGSPNVLLRYAVAR
jgi:dihydrofolate reductase